MSFPDRFSENLWLRQTFTALLVVKYPELEQRIGRNQQFQVKLDGFARTWFAAYWTDPAVAMATFAKAKRWVEKQNVFLPSTQEVVVAIEHGSDRLQAAADARRKKDRSRPRH